MLIDVSIPVPLHTTFSYDVPTDMAHVQPGMRVRVPFRRKSVVAVVSALNTQAPKHARIKPIDTILDEVPVVSLMLLDLCKWIAEYYAAPIGEVLQAALPPHLWKEKKREGKMRLSDAHSAHVRRDMQSALTLTEAQKAAVAQIRDRATPFSPILLHGVTGSGKTEVYMAACTDALAQNQQAIILVPEIALTPQLLGRFTERFGAAVAIYHSALTDAQRAHQWGRIQNGDATIVVGTRSAIFAPTPQCGLIIVDEEHDSSYKQDDSPRYNGRDVAVMRAKKENIPIVLGSATPSLESFFNAQRQKYHLITLPERATGQVMPHIQLVDMRTFKEEGKPLPLLSAPLIAALQKGLDAGEQSLLLMNRRGFSRFIVCEACGHVAMCPNCEVSLTYHQHNRELRCHYCDYHTQAPDSCELCKGLDLKPVGAGSERIEEELHALFPMARIGRLDSDTVSTQTKRTQLLQSMHNRELDIMVGTQMIAKGHDFSHVTFVGVVSAEMSLNMPDFRAPERSFQLLTQMSGRAGRAHLPGEVLIQTVQPEHYCLQDVMAHNYGAFAAAELERRRDLLYPPFGRLISCTISSNNETKGQDYATLLGDALRNYNDAHPIDGMILGPAPALMFKLRGKTRFQILVKFQSATHVHALTRVILAHSDAHIPSGVQVTIDVDPLNFI